MKNKFLLLLCGETSEGKQYNLAFNSPEELYAYLNAPDSITEVCDFIRELCQKGLVNGQAQKTAASPETPVTPEQPDATSNPDTQGK